MTVFRVRRGEARERRRIGGKGLRPTASELATQASYASRSSRLQKLSQEKLARLTDISLNTLTKIESGFTKRPAVQTIHKIAKALEASLDRPMEGDIR